MAAKSKKLTSGPSNTRPNPKLPKSKEAINLLLIFKYIKILYLETTIRGKKLNSD